MSELRQLQLDSMKTSPLFIVGGCQDSDKCSSDICGALLHKITITGLRVTTLDARVALRNFYLFSVNISLDVLARRMHGFRFGDVNSVITVAARSIFVRYWIDLIYDLFKLLFSDMLLLIWMLTYPTPQLYHRLRWIMQ